MLSFWYSNFENLLYFQKAPAKIFDDLSFETWHKLDKKFKNPFMIMKVNLFSPIVNASKEK